MKKRNWYTILLLVSLLLAAGWKMDMRVQKWQHERNMVDEAENTVDEFSPQTTEENITIREIHWTGIILPEPIGLLVLLPQIVRYHY